MSKYWIALILTGMTVGASLGKPFGYLAIAGITIGWILRKGDFRE